MLLLSSQGPNLLRLTIVEVRKINIIYNHILWDVLGNELHK